MPTDDNALQRKHRLTILLTDEEMAELRKRAGLVGMSVWARAQLFPTTPVFSDFKSYAVGDGAEKPEAAEPAKKNSRRTPPATTQSTLSPKVDTELPRCSHGALLNQCKKWGCKYYEYSNGRGV